LRASHSRFIILLQFLTFCTSSMTSTASAYVFEYNFMDVASLLRAYEPFVSLAAISRTSGINQHLLSHYANGMKKPRPQQRERIVQGIHTIGKELLAVV